nr:MAG TPA: hypothetical protein [Caudoviricetes sp.]
MGVNLFSMNGQFTLQMKIWLCRILTGNSQNSTPTAAKVYAIPESLKIHSKRIIHEKKL